MKKWIMDIRNATNFKFWIVIIIIIMVISPIILVNHFVLSKTVKYENDKYGFALMLPKSFANEVTILENENIFYFISKEIRDLDP